MNILKKIWDNILLISSLFLLIFIPLYPKIPLFDVSNTWVYVRVEDLAVATVLTLWIFLVLFKKVKLKTPLTIPIFIFWVIGSISTLHGVMILFPTIANVFPNVAFLSFIRRIEYISLFFIAFAAIRDRNSLKYFIWALTLTLILVVFYGLGQKYLEFPAFLTMNEEFAKGVALNISPLGRVSSTFAGHYDLAAYLVFTIPIFISLAFGFKNLVMKSLFLIVSLLGFGLLFLTVSRISLAVLIFSLFLLLIFQRKKFLIVALAFITGVFLIISPALFERFTNTVTKVDVLIDAKTGTAIGEIHEIPKEVYKERLILRHFVTVEEAKLASESAIVDYKDLPEKLDVLVPPNVPTGENLPSGTSYVNLSLSPIIKKINQYYLDMSKIEGGKFQEVREFQGKFLVKNARAFDLSFTTRFQGEWPSAINAFRRNVFLGSGYGSVSLAVDNDYLRILGESGILGFGAFVSIFLVAFLYIKKIFPQIDSGFTKSFILGFAFGSFGLILNAFLIDVFEASKIAYSYWILMGVVLGTVSFYKTTEFNTVSEIKNLLVSKYTVMVALAVVTFVLLFPGTSNYFVGDDFTWMRWAGESSDNLLSLLSNFINSEGFFYRPGAKLYFFFMYKFFWLNQTFYHFVSLFLLFLVAALLFLVLRKIFKNHMLATVGSFIFLILSSYHEVVFWISSTGFLFAALFSLMSFIFYIWWKENSKTKYFILVLIFSFLSPLFHEAGLVSALVILAYDWIFYSGKLVIRKTHLFLLSPLLLYLILRLISNSHWFSGDYSYNILKLPFNFIGNILGYLFLNLTGPLSISFYEIFRVFLRGNIILSLVFAIALFVCFLFLVRKIYAKVEFPDRKILVFGSSYFLISLLPYLGLGNITSRYSFFSTLGFVIVACVLLRYFINFLKNFEDRSTSYMLGFLAISIFLSLHLFQIQDSHKEWENAGKTSERFLISIQSIYKNDWKQKDVRFYFVNVPIKSGNAWIFPVGLKDALWFIIGNDNLSVSGVDSVKTAFLHIGERPNSYVFEFDERGDIHEYQRGLNGTIVKVR